MAGTVYDIEVRMQQGADPKWVTMIDPDGGDIEAARRIAERQFWTTRVLQVKARNEKRKP